MDDEYRPKREQAKSLPYGWYWEHWSDGSGSLHAPDGTWAISYDRTSYSTLGWTEYRVECDAAQSGGWSVFQEPFSEFIPYAEKLVSEETGTPLKTRGRLVVIEGTDGSGKATQTKLLCERLEQAGVAVKQLSFPCYESDSSALVKMYLRGDFGKDAEAVNPYAASTLYAVDRYASYMTQWREYYENGGLVVCDRYTTSNANHQGAKIDDDTSRVRYLKWLFDFEYGKIGIPKPDLVIYLDVPTEVTLALMKERNDTKHGGTDIHEANEAYLAQCRRNALKTAEYCGWRVISCAKDGVMRTQEDIANEIWEVFQNEHIQEL